MPKKTSGFTTRNQFIIIKLFRKSEAGKEATFIVYLHELAHYLQRIGCKNIQEANQNQSITNFNAIEGGNLLEMKIFGKILDNVAIEAVIFAASRDAPNTIAEFTKRFNELDVRTRGGKYISFKGSGKVICLGRCASKYERNKL